MSVYVSQIDNDDHVVFALSSFGIKRLFSPTVKWFLLNVKNRNV